MKPFYQHELEDLRTKLILIGEKANEAARLAIDGFLEDDLSKLNQAISLDDAIDELEVEIDQASVRYILQSLLEKSQIIMLCHLV